MLIYHKVDDINPEIYASIKFRQIGLPLVLFDRIKVQLQALGLIAPGTKRRSVSDNETYWGLTKKGEKLLINLQAKRKKEKGHNLDDTEDELLK